MQTEEAVTTQFELSDNIFAKATIKKPKAVGIWLGANVMVEYSFEEAIELLQKNLATAKKVIECPLSSSLTSPQSLTEVEDDLDFVKEQITIIEVSAVPAYHCGCRSSHPSVDIARIYNYDVKMRRRAKAAAAAAAEK